MGKSRAAAFALGIQDIDESVHVNTFSETLDSREIDSSEASHPESNSSNFFVLIEVLLTFHLLLHILHSIFHVCFQRYFIINSDNIN